MTDSVMTFKLALLSGGNVGIQFKDTNEAKLAFPSLIKDLEDYTNSNDYLIRMAKEMQEKKQPKRGNLNK